jgi:hypothetical protein
MGMVSVFFVLGDVAARGDEAALKIRIVPLRIEQYASALACEQGRPRQGSHVLIRFLVQGLREFFACSCARFSVTRLSAVGMEMWSLPGRYST